MRYFVNPETGLTFALPESDLEKWLIKPPSELMEIDMDMFRVIFEGNNKNDLEPDLWNGRAKA